MIRDSPTSLAPGFRFHPTDEELVRYYLRRKISGKTFRFDPIGVIDIYRSEPWDLPGKSKLKSRDLEWYFFSALDKKYGNGSRTNRATEKGYWKTTGKDRPVKHNAKTVGMKKTLVFHIGRAPHGTRTNWVMHEYKLMDDDSVLSQGISQKDSFVLCRIFQKSGTGPKNGEQYGAPLIEEEWDEDEKEGILHGENTLNNEIFDVDDFFSESNDLDQIDCRITSECAPRPMNFYHGESSNHVENYQNPPLFGQSPVVNGDEAFNQCNVEEVEPLGGNVETIEIHNDQSLGLNQHSVLEDNPVADTCVGDGSFLETNDLANPIGKQDTADLAMLDEYLTFFDPDDDITQYINFDVSETSENSIPIPSYPTDEQFVNDVMEPRAVGTTFDETATADFDGSSSKQKTEVEKFDSDVQYPFLKKASHMLGGTFAPPAFASEYPTKDAALRLQAAPQSSGSVDVTAAIIRIRSVTLRGNGSDWTLGKNGNLDITLSSYFPYTATATAVTAVPLSGISGKIAFMVSHGWMLLLLIWVMMLPLSCKIGGLVHISN